MRRLFIPAVLGLLVLVALAVSASAGTSRDARPAATPPTLYTLKTLQPSNFTSNGDLVEGWYWLRNAADTAEWTFNVSQLQAFMSVITAKRSSVYLNMSGLATRSVSGGSGYNGGLSIRLVGGKTVNTSIMLNNAFRPRELTSLQMNSTGGIGYAVYGASLVPYSAYQKLTSTASTTTMKLIVSRSNYSATHDIHVAVKADSPLIAYVVKSSDVG